MSRPIPDSLRPVLAFLVPLLGSDKDGEALGAARALGRKLRAAGCDFHDLAAVVSPPAPPPRPARSEQPKAKSARAESWRPPVYVELDDAQRATLQEQLGELVENRAGALNHWELKDAATILQRLEAGAQPPTAKMLERVEIMLLKIRRTGA